MASKKPRADADITILVLREIRDAVKATNERVDALTVEIRGTNERVEALHRLVVSSELRLATAVTDLPSATRDLASVVRETRAAERLAALEGRMAEVERKVG